jgi:hypothetical protein
VRLLGVISLACIFACASVWGQATAQIHGTVQDASGAAVPGAEVKATQTETGIARTVASGADGGYVLSNLATGPYQVEVTKEGFTKYVQSGIVLQVNSDPAIDPALKVGQLTEQVVVEASGALVETRSSGVGEVIQNERIVELPLNGRNVTDLIGMGGAAVQTGTTQTRWFNNLPVISLGGTVAAGGAGGSNLLGTEYMLDGANHLNILSGSTMPLAFPDAVQEFKAETTGQSAQRGASTSVSVVTKSGTNQLHGDVFEFLRNDGFGSAREYFSPVASTYKRNQFGGTVGGAIKKDKLFFFGGYQGTTIRQTLPSTTTVPTAQAMAGDFTTMASALCQGGTAKSLHGSTINNLPAAGTLFTNNTISPAMFTPQALFITNAYLNNLGGLTPNQCGNLTYQVPTHENDNQFVGKVDYQLSDKQSIFFRILESHILYPPPLTGCQFNLTTEKLSGSCLSNNIENASGSGENQLGTSDAIGDTFVISPTMVNSARIAYNRTAATLNSFHLFSLCNAGVNMWCGGTPGQLAGESVTGAAGIAGGTGLGDGDFWNGYSFAFNDDFSWIKHAHQMSFGFGAWQGRVDENNHFAPAGTAISFTGAVTGFGLTDFLLGDMTGFEQGLPNAYSSRQNNVDLYFTDTWKVSQRLTFNFGVRWEPFLPQSITNGQISAFDMSRFLAGTKSTVFVNAPPGFYFPGDPGFPGTSAAYKQWRHFDPRGGIAWDPRGDGNMSIRASYAFGYAFVPGIAHEDEGGSNPWGGRSTLSTPVGGLANPWNGANPFPYAVTPNVLFTPAGQFMTTDYNLPAPTSYSWNVSIQRQLGTTWLASVTYIGSRVQHLYINQAINYAELVNGPIEASGCAATATNCNAAANEQVRRIISLANPAAGALVSNMDSWYPYGTQLYDGLLSSVQKRVSRGVSLSANWTWSHCIGYFQGFNSKSEETATNPYDPLGDRGNCDSDRRQIVNLTAVAQAPNLSNRALHMVVTGWQLAGIYRYQSGAPFSVQDGTDQQLTAINHQRPNLVEPDAVYTGLTCGGCAYLNKAAFAAQPLGTVGNLGWNSVNAPAYWDIDLALSRQFRFRERNVVELRADAFNITNTLQPMAPVTAQPTSPSAPAFAAYNSNQFGQILSANPTRKIQFALKYTF